jgi:hypothetical protein
MLADESAWLTTALMLRLKLTGGMSCSQQELWPVVEEGEVGPDNVYLTLLGRDKFSSELMTTLEEVRPPKLLLEHAPSGVVALVADVLC